MQIEVKGRNCSVTDELREHVEKRFAKVGKQVSDLARLEVEVCAGAQPGHPDAQVAEATLTSRARPCARATRRATSSTRSTSARRSSRARSSATATSAASGANRAARAIGPAAATSSRQL